MGSVLPVREQDPEGEVPEVRLRSVLERLDQPLGGIHAPSRFRNAHGRIVIRAMSVGLDVGKMLGELSNGFRVRGNEAPVPAPLSSAAVLQGAIHDVSRRRPQTHRPAVPKPVGADPCEAVEHRVVRGADRPPGVGAVLRWRRGPEQAAGGCEERSRVKAVRPGHRRRA